MEKQGAVFTDKAIDPRMIEGVVKEEKDKEEKRWNWVKESIEDTDVIENGIDVDINGLPPGDSFFTMVETKEFVNEHELEEKIKEIMKNGTDRLTEICGNCNGLRILHVDWKDCVHDTRVEKYKKLKDNEDDLMKQIFILAEKV